jgi:hypothetical protein
LTGLAVLAWAGGCLLAVGRVDTRALWRSVGRDGEIDVLELIVERQRDSY